jgi:hypothetical protein
MRDAGSLLEAPCAAPWPSDALLTREAHAVRVKRTAETPLPPLPVVVRTTSRAAEDLRRASGRHANCYITTPGDVLRGAAVVRASAPCWCPIVPLP